ncbi:MAG: NAD-dependent malic enzyme, partial [Candidatus Humimicrobiaceae bacterium]
MNIYEKSLVLHKKYKGKIDVISKVATKTEEDLSLAYSPGVAQPCREIFKDPTTLNTYTSRGNMIAVVSDGSAVLGLGNIGPRAALPVMEGKCILFKNFGGVSAFPICLDSQDVDTIVETVKLLEPSFSGINLEDISAPRCFDIEARLKKETNMLTFHDDQHGTAVVALAGLFNACKL